MNKYTSRGVWLAPLAGLALVAALACGGISESRDLTPAEEAIVLRPEELVERLGSGADPASTKVMCSYMRIFGNASWRCWKNGRRGWGMEYEISTFVMESDTERAMQSDLHDDAFILRSNGYVVTPVDDAWSWGDDRECHSLGRDGAPAGILCMGRKGTYTVQLQVTGLPVEGEGIIDRVLGPELTALESWDQEAQ